MNGFFLHRDSLTVFFPRFLTMAQLVVFFWIASDLLRDEGLARKALLTYALSTSAVALGMIVGLTGIVRDLQDQRRSKNVIDGVQPEHSVGPDSPGCADPDGFVPHRASACDLQEGLARSPGAARIPALVSTGSRNGIVIFVLGFLVYLLPSRRYRGKPTVPILAMLAIVAIGYFVSQNSTILTRLQQTYETGGPSGRLGIYTEAIGDDFREALFGWRPCSSGMSWEDVCTGFGG